MRRDNLPFLGILAACTVTGCVELSATSRVARVGSNSGARFAETEQFHSDSPVAGSPFVVNNHTLPDLLHLQPGQQVRIAVSILSPEEMAQGNVSEVTQYAGIIESIDETRVILSNASILTEHATGVPVVSKVPYLSRLYKNSGSSIVAEPLPHGVVLPKSQIISVQPNIDTPIERIGVDFELTRH